MSRSEYDLIEGPRETKEQSDTAAAIVACDRLSGVLTDAPGAAGRWSSPQYLASYSL